MNVLMTDKDLSRIMSRCLSTLRVNSKSLKDQRSYVKVYETLCHVEETRLVVGSNSDGTATKQSDKDFLRILPGFNVQTREMIEHTGVSKVFVAERSNLGPGFTYLRIPTGFDKTQLPGIDIDDQYFKSDKFIRAATQATASVSSYFGSYQTKSKGTSVSRVHQKADYDDVYAIKCLQWPPEANEWISRDRPCGWPSAELIQIIQNSKCYVIPDAKTEKACWRYVFPEAEREIMWSLNDVQLQCFTILKHFHKSRLEKVVPDEISSFHLKTTLFWLLENSPNDIWIPENLITCLKKYLKMLQEYITRKYLPHYIQRERNIFAAKLECQRTRDQLVKEIQQIHDNLETDIMDYEIDQMSFQKAFEIIGFTKTGKSFLFTEQAEETLLEAAKVKRIAKIKVCENVFTFFHMLNKISCSENIPRLSSYHGLSKQLRCDRNDYSTVYIKFNRHFSQLKLGIHLLKGVLVDKENPDTLLKETEPYFVEGQNFDGFTGALYLVTYYVFCKNYEKANDILNKLLKNERYCSCAYTTDVICIKNRDCKLLRSWNLTSDWELAMTLQIFFNEIHLFPLAVQYEVCIMKLTERSKHGNFFMFAVLHQYIYFRFMQYLVSKNLLRSDIKEFDKAVRNSKDLDKSKYYICLNLLGYCYMAEGSVVKGLKCFKESLSEFPKTENMAAYYLCFYALHNDCRFFH